MGAQRVLRCGWLAKPCRELGGGPRTWVLPFWLEQGKVTGLSPWLVSKAALVNLAGAFRFFSNAVLRGILVLVADKKGPISSIHLSYKFKRPVFQDQSMRTTDCFELVL